MPRTYLYQGIGIRVVSVLIAVGLVVMLPAPYMYLAMIILGQGHFMLAYFYQAEGGHLSRHKVLVLIAFLAFFAWCAYVLPLPLVGFLTSIGFLLHFAIDEIRLMNGKYSLFTTLEALPYVILYGALLAEIIFNMRVLTPAFLVVLVIVAVYAWLSYIKKRKPNQSSYTSLAWLGVTLVTCALYLMNVFANALVLFAGLVLVHYLIWYGFYWFKLMNKTFVQTEYVMRAIVINMLLLVLAVLWILGDAPILSLLFAPAAFYVWTFLHGISSIRKNEFVSSVQLS